jgi:Bacterial EndoU nuclease
LALWLTGGVVVRNERFSKMQTEKVWTLDEVKADWARAFLFAPGDSPSSSRPPGAAHQLMKTLRRQDEVKRLAVEALKYRPDQPRISAGQSGGGQWTDGGGGGGTAGDGTANTSTPVNKKPIVVAANDGPKILGRGGKDFGQRVNTPSPRDINVRIGHILDNHTIGGSGFRTSIRDGGNKTMFPERMSPQDIDRAVREAYSNSRDVSSPHYNPNGKIRELEGESGGLTIRMYYNSDEKTIDAAFPRY